MPSTTGRPKRKRVAKPQEERLQDLLDAAQAVFYAKGVSDATVGEITDRAGVAKGTFYLYFQSKQHVVASLWERYVNDLLGIADRTFDGWPGEQGDVGVISDFIESLTDHAIAHAELHRIVYSSADAEALELCRSINQRVVDRLADVIRRGNEAGLFRSTHPELAARILYHGAHGTMNDATAGTVAADRDQLVAAFREVAGRVITG